MELNREILIEGNSLIITLVKTISKDENKSKRVNVQKIASLKDLFNKPVNEVVFSVKSLKDLDKLSEFVSKEGSTEVRININDKDKDISIKLKNKRLIDRKAINILRNKNISAIIH